MKGIKFVAVLTCVGLLALGLITPCFAQSTFGQKLGPQSSQPSGDLATNSGAKSAGPPAGGED